MNTMLSLAGVASVERLADVRHTLRRWLAGEVDPESIVVVELVATEMITNAVVHGGGLGVPSAELRQNVVRLEVHDESMDLPQMRSPGPGSTSGRGMRIIATTSDRWGIELTDEGKTVWSEIPVQLVAEDDEASSVVGRVDQPASAAGGSASTPRWKWTGR